ncbi:alpha/beta hydrolase [Pontibacter oryzae]|uniref:BD-FAE-like domain-containing protein n=1 Tax=Pontibacter oryzae TaxID=2304593 RepID=A0A399SJL4_9BACT|nr:alpha/beta hydrolase [Pontibacter oryzae]RIJ43099.1 hypothetical protein D1627_04525 [Pontibacter oryzae]
MKHLLFFICSILFLLQFSSTFATQTTGRLTVSGTIKHPTVDSVFLDGRAAALDAEGNFSFALQLDQPRYLTLKIKHHQVSIYAEPGKPVTLTFDEQAPKASLKFKGPNSAINTFLQNQKAVSDRFNAYFNQSINTYLTKLPEQAFVHQMDSLKATFLDPLNPLRIKHPNFATAYETEITLMFLSFLADYPLLHLKNTGESVCLSEASQAKLNAIDVNNPELFKYEGFQRYLKNFLYRQINQELKTHNYTTSDNQRLDAGFAIIPELFRTQEVLDEVLYTFLLNHIENLGIKNIANSIVRFEALCKNDQYLQDIRSRYERELSARQDHLILPYKTIRGYTLDAHIFLPDTLAPNKQYPAIAMFHGGSFFEGKPDWFFASCREYARKGWVAVAVEYSVADRHGNLLPEAIADGKSLVRYLRENAAKLQVDPSRIMVTGNSAGATIALALATIGEVLDEPTENLKISSTPNAIMANAALADLTETGHYWWHKHYTDKYIASVSPLHQVRAGLPPMLLLHGTNDTSVDMASVKEFVQVSSALSNSCVFVPLNGAPHMIWRIPYFANQIEQQRQSFIKSLGWLNN